jgi:hypothetical protein
MCLCVPSGGGGVSHPPPCTTTPASRATPPPMPWPLTCHPPPPPHTHHAPSCHQTVCSHAQRRVHPRCVLRVSLCHQCSSCAIGTPLVPAACLSPVHAHPLVLLLPDHNHLPCPARIGWPVATPCHLPLCPSLPAQRWVRAPRDALLLLLAACSRPVRPRGAGVCRPTAAEKGQSRACTC